MKPFFIGWMRPRRRMWLLLPLVMVVLAVIDVGLVALLVAAEPPRHTGFWDQSGEKTFEGVLVRRPYPMVRLPAAKGQAARVLLLADEWKFGLPLGPEFKDGDKVRVQGYVIRRGDVMVLQVDNELRRIDASPPPVAPLQSAGTRTLVGEIVDSKCWTGAMNPGDGKAHKGCGSLCLLGGIPALFIAQAPDGAQSWFVLADPGGASLGEGIRARIGERLTLTGQILDAPDLHEFRIDPDELVD